MTRKPLYVHCIKVRHFIPLLSHRTETGKQPNYQSAQNIVFMNGSHAHIAAVHGIAAVITHYKHTVILNCIRHRRRHFSGIYIADIVLRQLLAVNKKHAGRR